VTDVELDPVVASAAGAAAPGFAPGAAARAPLPWRDIVRWALLGMVALLLFTMVDVSRHGGGSLASVIQPGLDGPSTAAFAEDFPEIQQPPGSGLDGQQYYAIARDPLHLDETADQLDNPRYRLQRPLLPWTAWILQPTGGGMGLVAALFAVGLAAIFGGALAAGALATMWRGPAWVAAVLPVLPGAYWSLRVTVSDAMALSLALAAIALAARSRHAPAIAVGVLAVLAKEPAILLLLGWALHRRTRRDALLVVVPGAAIVAWMAWLAVVLPPDTARPNDLALPFAGLVGAWTDVWSRGDELVGMACTLGALAIGGATLALRRFRHPLGFAIAIQLGFLLIMGTNPTAVNFGATRMAMPVMMLSVIALATPRAAEAG
jgi:hypothetical protein